MKQYCVQLGLKEIQNRVDQLRSCLVRRYVISSNLMHRLIELRQWVIHLWSLKRGCKLSTLGGALVLYEFEDGSIVERMLVRGSCNFKGFVLPLWSQEVFKTSWRLL